MFNKCLLLLVLLASLWLLAGCAAPATEAPPMEGAYVTGAQVNAQEAGRDDLFEVRVEEAGQPIGLDFRGTLISGSMSAQLAGPDGQVAWEAQVDQIGPFAVNTVFRPEQAGEYSLAVVWDGPVQAQYALRWKPGEIELATIRPAALLGGLGMLAVAVGFVLYAILHRLGVGYLALGAAAWVVTVALKFAWAIPVNPPVQQALFGALPAPIAGPLFYLYVGLLTGVFEVGLVWLVLRYTRLGKRERWEWRRAVAFGIGFGAVEALLLGLSSLISVIAVLAMPSLIPPASLEQIARLNNVAYGLAPIVERLAVVVAHLFSNVLILYGIVTRKSRWFWWAFLYKTALDSMAAFGQFWGLETLGKIWTLEAVIIVFGVIGWWGVRWVARRYPAIETKLEQEQVEASGI